MSETEPTTAPTDEPAEEPAEPETDGGEGDEEAQPDNGGEG